MVSRDKVAKLAGVSPETVSRVFRNFDRIAPATRAKVLKVSRRCGYVPHSAARAMRSGKFQRIACVITQYGPKGSSHCTYNGYLDPATDLLAERGYSVLFEPFHLDVTTYDFVEAPRLFTELAVDGILGINAASPVPSYVDKRLKEMGAPAVWMNRDLAPGVSTVLADEKSNGRILARHLIELGHERIGFFGRPGPHYSTIDRGEGVREELASAGLDTSYVIETRHEQEVDDLERLMDRAPRLTALVCYNIQFYQMALHAAVIRGLRVPKDLSLCHVASVWELPTFVNYPATVVTIPEPDIARTAVERLLGAIEGIGPGEGATFLPGHFLPGFSTARPGEEADKVRMKEYMKNRKAFSYGQICAQKG
jgi:DNA-binding LacI/PurR family transcriptional regulator